MNNAAILSNADEKYSFTDSLGLRPETHYKGRSELVEHNTRHARGNVVVFPASRLDRKTIFIQDLGDVRVSLREPLAVSIETCPDHVTAYSYDLGEFAFANDELDALDEFKASIVDLYFLLRDEQDNLGPLPLKHWNFLKSVVQEN